MDKMFLGMVAAAPTILAALAASAATAAITDGVTVNDYVRDNPAGPGFAQPSGANGTSARFLCTIGL
ncbi:MAG: hypothetical protein WCF81_00625 [Roseiarcus sp.]